MTVLFVGTKEVYMSSKEEVVTVYPNEYGIAFCPTCKGALWQNRDETKYCFRCGQRVQIETSRRYESSSRRYDTSE